MSEILGDGTIKEIANSMRMKRNMDFYNGGVFISEKESKDYYNFTKEVLGRIKSVIGSDILKE